MLTSHATISTYFRFPPFLIFCKAFSHITQLVGDFEYVLRNDNSGSQRFTFASSGTIGPNSHRNALMRCSLWWKYVRRHLLFLCKSAWRKFNKGHNVRSPQINLHKFTYACAQFSSNITFISPIINEYNVVAVFHL